MRKALQRGWAALDFARLDVRDPHQVARYMFRLEGGEWPEEAGMTSEVAANEVAADEEAEGTHTSPADQQAFLWGDRAPGPRMARLLWQLLQDNYSEDFLRNQFTTAMEHFEEDAVRCGEVLPSLQDRLRWVLNGVETLDRQELEMRQSGERSASCPGNRRTTFGHRCEKPAPIC